MNLTNIQVFNIATGLNNFSDSTVLPSRVVYAIEKNKVLLNSMVSVIIKTVELIENKYKEMGQNAQVVFREDVLADDYVREMNELNNIMNEDIQIQTINISSLDGYELSPKDMQALFFMIQDDSY